MRRPDRIDAGLVAVSFLFFVALTRLVPPENDFYWGSVIFWSILGALLCMVVRVAIASGGEALAARRRANRLVALDPAVAALEAVADERGRLSAEIDTCLYAALTEIRAELDSIASAADLRGPARRIHRRTRQAASELRRQLGLLRDPPRPRSRPASPPDPAPRLTSRTLLLAAFATALAGADLWSYETDPHPDTFVTPWSEILTMLAASSVVGWRVAPVAAALWLGVLALGPRLLFDVMVSAGGWMVATVGCLTWALATRGPRDLPALGAALFMGSCVVASRAIDDPLNVNVTIALVVVPWLLGTIVGANRRRSVRADEVAEAREAEVAAAREEAVAAERLAVARELHDVMSHAIGVIAAQAAAAQVSWPRDEQAARRAFAIIEATTSSAIGELDRVLGGETVSRDLDGLVRRIRAAGTTVRAELAPAPPQVEGVVYRVVQEGLTNAVRHAPGAAIEVRVRRDDAAVTVTVSDDGPGAGDGTPGFGLTGLRERVTLSGGRFSAGSGPGGGFRIVAELPVRAEACA